jgi:hypothetical protein
MIARIVPIDAHRPSKIVAEVEQRHLDARYQQRARTWSDGVNALCEHRRVRPKDRPQA